MALPTPATGLESRIRRERQRVERALAFAREVSIGLRADFPDVFTRPGGWPEGSRERELFMRLAAMDREAQAAAAALRAVPQAVALETLQRLEALELVELASAANAVQALGDALRAPAVQAQRPAPARPPGPPTGQGPDVALIRGLAPRPRTQALAPRPGTSPPRPGNPQPHPGSPQPGPGTQQPRPGAAPSRPGAGAARPASQARPPYPPPRPITTDRASLGARHAFDAALKVTRDVLGYVSPRLQLVAVALDVTGLPGAARPWATVEAAAAPSAERAGVAPPLRGWVPVLARQFIDDAGAVRLAHQAVVQWKQARALAQTAEKLEGSLASAPPTTHGQLLAGFDASALRAAIYPLGHLHVHFRGVPHLSTLFPPPK